MTRVTSSAEACASASQSIWIGEDYWSWSREMIGIIWIWSFHLIYNRGN